MGPCECAWITGAWMQYQEQMHIQWPKLKTWWINWVGSNTPVHWIKSEGTARCLSPKIYNKQLPLSLPSDFISLGGGRLGRWESQPLSRGRWTNCWSHFVTTSLYLDDLVIISLSWSEHLQHLGANCQRLQETGLIAKPQMCQSWIAQRVYLGHIVGEGRVKRKLPSSKQPRSSGVLRAKKVHLFLGLTGSLYSITHQWQAYVVTDLTWKCLPNQVVWTPEIGEGVVENYIRDFIRGHIQNGDIYAAREGDKGDRGTICGEIWRSLP